MDKGGQLGETEVPITCETIRGKGCTHTRDKEGEKLKKWRMHLKSEE